MSLSVILCQSTLQIGILANDTNHSYSQVHLVLRSTLDPA